MEMRIMISKKIMNKMNQKISIKVYDRIIHKILQLIKYYDPQANKFKKDSSIWSYQSKLKSYFLICNRFFIGVPLLKLQLLFFLSFYFQVQDLKWLLYLYLFHIFSEELLENYCYLKYHRVIILSKILICKLQKMKSKIN